MIKTLKIANYALIEELEVEFRQGFSVITGETGAGKSILLGALGLVLGNRADTDVIKDKDGKCIVEAMFDIRQYHLKDIFDENNIDYDDLTILRREITPSGKSRAFINDTPVNLNLMKILGERLVDIHSQHASLLLNDPLFQLSVIDSFAGLNNKVDEYSRLFDRYVDHLDELAGLRQEESEARKEEDYYRFLFEELEKARLKESELEDLEEQQKMLSNAEEIKEVLFGAVNLLNREEQSIIALLNEIKRKAEKFSSLSQELYSLNQRLTSAIIELEDISREYDSVQEKVEYNPALLEEVNERLDVIYKLLHKHGAGSVAELIDLKEEYDRKLQSISSLSAEIETLERETTDLEKAVVAGAAELSVKRQEIFSELESKTASILQKMGMPDGVVKIGHTVLEKPNRKGIDEITLLFSANKGVKPEKLSRIASGGELSRLMLSIKSLVSERKLLPTIIFDEIDNGISGDIAGRVGEVMLHASTSMQVIAITHLPQIAGKGQHHYLVFKETREDTTVSRLRKISDEERIIEIANMLSGEDQTSATRETAREFLKKTGTKN